MGRMSYSGLNEATNPRSGKKGMDMVRGYQVGTQKIKIKYFEEVYASKELLVRIYRVRPTTEIDRMKFVKPKKKKLRKTANSKKYKKPIITINYQSNTKKPKTDLRF